MLGKGNLGVHVRITTQDEVGQVGQVFNQISDKLEDQQRLRHQMIPLPGGTLPRANSGTSLQVQHGHLAVHRWRP